MSYLKKIQKGLTANQRLQQIVEHGMCIGCGLCESIAGAEKIKMKVSDTGAEIPVTGTTLDHALMDQIMRVCPGTVVHGLPQHEVNGSSQYDAVWGIWQDIKMAYATDPDIRHLGSTGGLLTALGLYLIESGEVDFIVHATASSTQPTFGERVISRNRKQVIAAAGSRYGPTATLIDITDILGQEQPFAFIGTPCDISALRNLAREDDRVNRWVKYMLTMVCGGFMQTTGMRQNLVGYGS